MRDTLGGKGANLAEMTRLGVPVPPGCTISTEACLEFQRRHRLSAELKADVLTALARVEQIMDARFGDPERPLLVSVRSGARASMPGMMDTVLNLGLNDETVRDSRAFGSKRATSASPTTATAAFIADVRRCGAGPLTDTSRFEQGSSRSQARAGRTSWTTPSSTAERGQLIISTSGGRVALRADRKKAQSLGQALSPDDPKSNSSGAALAPSFLLAETTGRRPIGGCKDIPDDPGAPP